MGASAAWGLAEEGAECILLDRSRDELQATIEIAAHRGPGPFHALVCDLSDRESTLRAAARAREAARSDLTALVHCAAIMHLTPIEETTDAQVDEMLEVNLTSAFLLVRDLMPELRAGGGGSILLTSSRAGNLRFLVTRACTAQPSSGSKASRKHSPRSAVKPGSWPTRSPRGPGASSPPGLSRAEEAAIPAGERTWSSSEALGAAFAAFALLPGFEGAPNGCRFEADRVAGAVRANGLPLPREAWGELGSLW